MFTNKDFYDSKLPPVGVDFLDYMNMKSYYTETIRLADTVVLQDYESFRVVKSRFFRISNNLVIDGFYVARSLDGTKPFLTAKQQDREIRIECERVLDFGPTVSSVGPNP